MGLTRCSKCRKELPRDAFTPRHTQCKTCRNAYQKEWRAANRDLNNQRERDRRNALSPERRARLSANAVVWARANPEKRRAIRARYSAKLLPLERRLPPAIARLRNRNGGKPLRDETLAILPALLGDPCSYCGGPGGEIDHIDPFGDSEYDNLTGCCRQCNARKHQVPLLQTLLGTQLRLMRDALDEEIRLLQPEWASRGRAAA